MDYDWATRCSPVEDYIIFSTFIIMRFVLTLLEKSSGPDRSPGRATAEKKQNKTRRNDGIRKKYNE